MPVYPYTLADGSKRYRVVYWTPQHRQKSKSGFRRKTDAQAFEATITTAKAEGTYIPAERGKATIGQLGPKWLEGKKLLKPSAYVPLDSAWRVHVEPRWGTVKLSDLEHSDIQAWVSEMTAHKSATTVLRAFGVLHGIITSAVLDKRLSVDPAAEVKLPKKTRKKHVYLSHEQLWALADASGDYRVLVLVLGYCGLRWGEAIALRPSDIDFEKGRISVTRNAVQVASNIHVGSPKTHKSRSVPVPKTVLDLLETKAKDLGDDELIFASPWGNFLHRPGTGPSKRSWFKTAQAKVGLAPMTVHDLRHTAASLAVSVGANVKAVQRMLGHKSAAVTLDVYADLFDDDLDSVSDALEQAIISTNVAASVAETRS